MERESEEQYLQARINQGEKRLEKVKAYNREYGILVANGNKLLERAYDTYMEGDREEDWLEFERCMREAVTTFQNAIAILHKLAEIIPSQVKPQRCTELTGIISRIDDTLLDYHQNWGKRVKAEDQARIQALTHWTCASLLVAGIHNADMDKDRLPLQP